MKSTHGDRSRADQNYRISKGNLPSRFRIADWTVDTKTCRLSRGDEAVKLEPKVMDVLAFLASRPGEVVSREALEAAVWAGTVVGYDTVTGAIQKLRRAFDDSPRQPRIIETLSKKGYRLLEPVIPLIEPSPSAPPAIDESFSEQNQRSRSPPRLGLASLAIALLFVVAALTWLRPWVTGDSNTHALEPSPKSVAVLPFDNLSGDPDQEYFVDGMTDDLITYLAKIPDLFVIARDSTFIYKGQPLDSRKVADRLGVRYLLRGSVRKTGQNVRINAQLIDASKGNHIWAESYDMHIGGIFEVQDRIIQRIVSALAARMNVPEREELGRPKTKSHEAYDSFLQGRQRFFHYANKDENRKARELFTKAVEFDPDFAMAYAMLAWTHAFDAMNGWSQAREQSLLHARELATKALTLEEALPLAYFVIGLSYRETGEYLEALVEAEKAIRYDPNYANAHVLLATLLYYAGRPEEGLEQIKKAILLNPHHPYNYTFHLGQAYYILRRYDEAIEAFQQGLDTNPASERLHVWLAAAYAQAGFTDEAEWEADQVLTLNPTFSIERMQETFPFKDPADLAHFQSGLRKAGFSQLH
jgi:TolB-like protein/DNA-binding winged helix-turn-helix (wHTH) protein/Flp pilus assembly protein TadD